MAAARHQKKPVKKPSRASSSKGAAKSENPTPWQRHERDIWIVVLVVVGLLAALAEAGLLGPVGRAISEALKLLFGAGRFFLPPLLVALGVALVWGKVEVERSRFAWGLALGLVAVCGLGDLAGGRPGVHATVAALGHAGGWIGVLIGGGLHRALGVGGAVVVLLALLVVAIMIVTGIGLKALVAGSVAFVRALGRLFSKWWTARPMSSS
ncbi:MAG: DNA translocase FtsK 4TM domain-containing protein, partial [Acidimicrobiales bacterium]